MTSHQELRSLLRDRYDVKVPGVRERVWKLTEALTLKEAHAVAERLRQRRRGKHADLLMAWIACRPVSPMHSTTRADIEANWLRQFGTTMPKQGRR